MFRNSLAKLFGKRTGGLCKKEPIRPHKKAPRCRPTVEKLEDRIVPFKPYTHVMVATDALADAIDDGKVTIEQRTNNAGQVTVVQREYALNQELVDALRNHPEYYKAGAVAGDGFPDLFMGQSVLHPENAGAWGQRVLDYAWAWQGADRPQVLAWAHGYMSHLAGDVWAHTLVNEFTGGTFPDLFDDVPTIAELSNAARHIVVEGYIADATPGFDGSPVREQLFGDQVRKDPLCSQVPLGAPCDEDQREFSSDSTPGLDFAAPRDFIYQVFVQQGVGPSEKRGAVIEFFEDLSAGLRSAAGPRPEESIGTAVNTINSAVNNLSAVNANQAPFRAAKTAYDACTDFFDCTAKGATLVFRAAQLGFETTVALIQNVVNVLDAALNVATTAVNNAYALTFGMYFHAWADDIDEGLRHWSEFGLGLTNAFFNPQSKRDAQNSYKVGVKSLSEEIHSRVTTEDGVGIKDVILYELDNNFTDSAHDGKSFFSNHLLKMLGVPDFLVQVKDLLGNFTSTIRNAIGNVLAPLDQAFKSVVNPIDVLTANVSAYLGGVVETMANEALKETFGVNILEMQDLFKAPSRHLDSTSINVGAFSVPLFQPGDHAKLDAYLGITGNHHTDPAGFFDGNGRAIPGGILQDNVTFNKDVFAAYRNAVTMTKLAYLDGETMDQFVSDFLGWTDIGQSYGRYSLYGSIGGGTENIFTVPLHDDFFSSPTPWLKSIDGDHQWRADGRPVHTNPSGGNGNFPLWESCLLRDGVFRKTFIDWQDDFRDDGIINQSAFFPDPSEKTPAEPGDPPSPDGEGFFPEILGFGGTVLIYGTQFDDDITVQHLPDRVRIEWKDIFEGGVKVGCAGFKDIFDGATTLYADLGEGSDKVTIDYWNDLTIFKTIGTWTFTAAAQGNSLTVDSDPGSFYSVHFPKGGTITNAVTFNNTTGVIIGDEESDVMTFAGGMTSTASTTTLNGTIRTGGASLTLGAVSLGTNVTLDATNNGSAPAGGNITLGAVDGAHDLQLKSGTTGAIALDGDIGSTTPLGVLTVDAGGASSMSGILAGASSSLVKRGAGALTVTAANTYGGGTTVHAGKLIASNSTGSGTGSGSVVVNSGGTLGGAGTVTGAVTVNNGATVAPGTSAGILSSGDVSFASGSNFSAELNGTSLAPTPQYDQLNVTGGVTIDNANLNVTVGFTPTAGDSFTIINNDGSEPITVTNPFRVRGTPIPEGGVFSVGFTLFTLTYAGGTDNNDVVLTVVNGFSISALDAVKAEGSGGTAVNFTFTVSRTGGTPAAIDYAVSGSGATPASAADFDSGAFASGTFNFTPADASFTLTIPVKADAIVEADQDFIVTLSNPVGGTLPLTNSATGTIQNDDTATLALTAPTITETDADFSVNFTATLDADVEGGFQAAFSSVLGSAEASDFTVTTTSPLTFIGTVGETQQIAVTIEGDDIVESDEGFTIQVDVTNTTAVQDAAITSDGLSKNINNDDTATLSLTAPTITETDSDFSINFTATLDAVVEGGFQAAIGTVLGSAEAIDYTVTTISPLTFNGTAGETQQIAVTIEGDNIVEDSESFTIQLDVTNTTAVQDAAITSDGLSKNINNDDTATLSLTAPTITETDADFSVNFTATLDADVEGGFQVAFNHAPGSAQATDYTVTTTSPLTFTGTAGETQQIAVTIEGDNAVEPSETFSITLGDVTNTTAVQDTAITTGASATGTIENDDTATLSLSAPTITETDADFSVNVTVTLNVAVAGGFQVAFSHLLGSAEATDYTVTTTSPLTFTGTSGETQQIAVTIKGDNVVEDNESFTIELGAVTNTTAAQIAAIGSVAFTTSINNDDTATLALTAPTITETDTDFSVNFTATLDAAVEGGFQAAFSHVLGSAEATDYTVTTTSPLTFTGTAGETRQIAITIEGDDIVESNESFTIQLGAVTNTTPVQGAAITRGALTRDINNDDTATLSLIAPTTITETDADFSVNFTATLSAAVEGGFKVAFSHALGSAQASDYTVTTASPLTFAGTANETRQIAVTIEGDVAIELNETFSITLGDVTNTTAVQDAAITTGASATGTIADDDAFKPSAPIDVNPAGNSAFKNAPTGMHVGIKASSTDPQGTPVSYSLTSDSSGGAFFIDPSSGDVSVANGSLIDFGGSGGSYTITVRASDGQLTSSASFTIQVPSQWPVLSSPQPTFFWTAVPGKTAYEVWVTNLTTGQNPALKSPISGGTSWTASTSLVAGHSYRWWVGSYSQVPFTTTQTATWGAPTDFVAPNPVAPPIPYGLGSAASQTPSLTWTPGGTTTVLSYSIWLARTTAPAQSPLVQATSTTTSLAITAPVLTPGHSYRWWVQARLSTGTVTAWSTYSDFTVAPLAMPTASTPSGTTAISTSQPNFTWTTATGPSLSTPGSYWLWVDQIAANSSSATTLQSKVVNTQGITGTSYNLATLAPGHYRWWIAALSSNGLAAPVWSAPKTFTIAATLVSPVTVSSSAGVQPTFTWSLTSAPSTVRYEIWLERVNATGTNTLVYNNANITTTTLALPTTLTSGQRYRWWVRAYVNGTLGVWSLPSDFLA